jgi:hypothetical protein
VARHKRWNKQKIEPKVRWDLEHINGGWMIMVGRSGRKVRCDLVQKDHSKVKVEKNVGKLPSGAHEWRLDDYGKG